MKKIVGKAHPQLVDVGVLSEEGTGVYGSAHGAVHGSTTSTTKEEEVQGPPATL